MHKLPAPTSKSNCDPPGIYKSVKMFKVLFFLGYLFVANAQLLVAPRVDYVENNVPTPYRFSYTAPAIGGGSSHEETGDGQGRVQGSYTVEDEDGRSRVVQYIADEGGFRASISTNEPGTATSNPADVQIVSSADGGQEAPAVQPVPVVQVIPQRVAAPLPVAGVPIQPNFVPIDAGLVPIQPALIPAPALIPQRFVTQPGLFPLGPQLIGNPFAGNFFGGGIYGRRK